MTLRDVVMGVASLDDEATIFIAAGQPVTTLSAVVVAALSEDHGPSPKAAGLRELMDVWQVREVLKGLGQRQGHELGRPPTQNELLERFMLFLKNDA